MKKSILAVFAMCALSLAIAADVRETRRCVLVVQNHSVRTPNLPMSALADTLVAQLAGNGWTIVNPANVIGVRQNRTVNGEAMPEASAMGLAQMLGADGIITASVQDMSSTTIRIDGKIGAYRFKAQVAIALADAATGATLCGEETVDVFRNVTASQVEDDTNELYERLLHEAAVKCAAGFIKKAAGIDWNPKLADVAHVNFTCNIQGADVKVDGVAMGTIPAMVSVPKGVHNLVVEYPFCVPYSTKAYFTDGQTYNVVLLLDSTGRERFKSEALFAETIDRIRKTGETDDYVRRTLADGTAQYWKNSGVKIDKGEVKDLKLAPPGGAETVAPRSPTVDQLMEKAREL